MTPQEIIAQTNAYRKTKGLPPLTSSSALQKAAEAAAKDMTEKKYFSHTTPDGKDFRDFVVGSSTYQKLGQNLARYYQDATTTMEGWKASKTHEANLSDGLYNEIGVAVVPGENYVVQYFGKLPDKTQAKPAPATKPAVTPEKSLLHTDSKAPIDFSKLNMSPLGKAPTKPL